jgi:hypothetical protein
VPSHLRNCSFVLLPEVHQQSQLVMLEERRHSVAKPRPRCMMLRQADNIYWNIVYMISDLILVSVTVLELYSPVYLHLLACCLWLLSVFTFGWWFAHEANSGLQILLCCLSLYIGTLLRQFKWYSSCQILIRTPKLRSSTALQHGCIPALDIALQLWPIVLSKQRVFFQVQSQLSDFSVAIVESRQFIHTQNVGRCILEPWICC